MSSEITNEAKTKMDHTINFFHQEVAGVRTGRASTHLLDGVKADYYGAPTPIPQMAAVSTPDARTIVIQPWDESQVEAVEKAIMNSDIGITPNRDGKVIRLNLPTMTEDRRKELAKLVKKMGEDNKIAVRNVRRDAIEKVKKQVKDKDLPEDDGKKLEDEIQKLTDQYTDKIDSIVENKEQEIMET